MKEKSVTFCFLKSKAKGKSKFLQSHQLLAEAVAMEWWKRKTRNYHQKLNVRVASRLAEQFRAYDLKK